MFTPHELHPRSRKLSRIPFPSLTPFAGSANPSLSPELGTPLPIPLATPVVPRHSQAPRLPKLHSNVVDLGDFGAGSPETGKQVLTGLQRSRLGNVTPDMPASPLLWPSRTPLQTANDTPGKSASLGSLPKPSASLQDSRDRDRGKSGLLSSLHAQSSARRPQHPSQTPGSPSLPKAARADPALVNFPISASREHLGSSWVPAHESTEQAGGDGSASPTPVVLIPESHSERMRSTATELQPGARRKQAPVSSSLLTSADASSRASAHRLRPAAAEAAQSRAGSQWVPMQPAQKRGLQPLGSGKLRVSSAAAPSGRAETESGLEERPSASHPCEAAPPKPSCSIQQQAPADGHSTKGGEKERLAQLQEMLEELGGLMLPQPLQPMRVRVPPPAASCGEEWVQEHLAKLHSLQGQAADALAAQEEGRGPKSNRASTAGVSVAAQFEAAWRAAASLSPLTQPAQRHRQLEGLSSSSGSGRRGGRSAAHPGDIPRPPGRIQSPAGASTGIQAIAERLQRLQALQSEAAQLLLA